MPRWRIMVRRDTAYEITADTYQEACEAAECEDFSMIESDELDFERVLHDESFQIDDEGHVVVEDEEN